MLLGELGLESAAFFKNLMAIVSKESDTFTSVPGNAVPFSDYLTLIKSNLIANNSIELFGSLKGQSNNNLYRLDVRKGIFNKEEMVFIQIHDLSPREKIKALEDTISYREHVLNAVAHDLRNPLGAITGLLEVIEKSIEDEDVLENIKTCKTTGGYIMNILNTYLDGSQIKKNKLKLVPTEIPIKSYLDDLSKMYDFMCKEKGLEFNVKIKQRTPRVIVSDQHRLTQILTNLISNAIKFTSSGYVCLHISADRKPNSLNPMITFTVEDTGIGIPLHLQQHLFKTFSRIESSANLNPYGVGLGLIISNELVNYLNTEEKNAHIKLESEPGKGSNFSFTISSMITETLDSKVATPSLCLDLFNSSNEDNHRNISLSSAVGDMEDGIGEKMLDYSKDYGRLNGSKFHSPKHKVASSPHSLSLLFDYSCTDAGITTKNPATSNIRLTTNNRKSSFLKFAFADSNQRIVNESTPRTPKSETNDKLSNFLRPSILIPRGVSSMERITTPSSKISRFKPDKASDQHILVVDDESFNIKVVKYLLNKKGFEVSWASNGEECIQMVNDKLKDHVFFKGILMDCNMPVMDGYETTRRLKIMMDEEKIPKIPIIGLSAMEDENSVALCKDVGMIHVIDKPLSEDKLTEVLKLYFPKVKCEIERLLL